MALPNIDALAGGGGVAGRLYRELVAATLGGHNALCDAYGLDRDDIDGGTWWGDIVRLAMLNGDIDVETMTLT